MGMTDRQFDAFQQNLLRRLERAENEVATSGKSKELEEIIEDIKNQLRRP